MSRVIYFDCFSGISGDMALGALVDAGLPVDQLRAELEKLEISGWALDAEPGMRSFLAGTRAIVHAPEQETHRHLADVRQIIRASRLSDAVKQRSIAIFTLLAEAEGRVHGIGADQVHFHEVGALDAIIDVVGVVAGLELLDIDEVYASALPLGSGWVRAAHGRLPVPAPATLILLAGCGAPVTADDFPAELVTPTGAALLAGLATFLRPAMRLERIGHGLGGRNPESRPNALRVWVGTIEGDPRPRSLDLRTAEPYANDHGETAAVRNTEYGIRNTDDQPPAISHQASSQSTNPDTRPLVLLETNIDDQTAEQLAYVAERLMAGGALDVWMTAIQMKKGRPGVLLSALIPEELENQMVTLLLRETTTLGVRRRLVDRHVCERVVTQLETSWGPVRIKHKYWRGEELGAAPEFEDCARIAREHDLPIRAVYLASLRQKE
jgi:uncharacterized protein (TIGR00299 family) protein